MSVAVHDDTDGGTPGRFPVDDGKHAQELPSRPIGDRRRPRRGMPVVVSLGAVFTIAAVAGAAAVGFGGGDEQTPASSGLPPATTPATRTTLIQTKKVSGTLGYGDATSVSARAAGGASGPAGTLTWLPPAGSGVERGQQVYRVDDKPVTLLYGSMPMYRTLQAGLSGGDVRQLEENLSAVGYSGFTVDDEYTSYTASAVRDWQADLGLEQTGTVDVGQVVVAPGAIRVAELKSQLGGQATGEVLTYTGSVRSVAIDLAVADQHLVTKDIEATVTLPDGRNVKGTVTRIGTVATTSSAGGTTTPGAGGGSTATTTIDVVVSVGDQNALGTLEQAPVDVTLVASQRKDVLTVPVGALVALAEGGYGVQVIEGATTRYVAVRTGMFAGGRVEVSGDGIIIGTLVGVPK